MPMKTNTSYRDINTLKDLKNYRAQLKVSYQSTGEQIRADIRQKILGIPGKLFRPKDALQSLTKKIKRDGLVKLISSASGKLIKSALPKSMGSIKKWAIGLLVSKSLGAFLSPKTHRKNSLQQRRTLGH